MGNVYEQAKFYLIEVCQTLSKLELAILASLLTLFFTGGRRTKKITFVLLAILGYKWVYPIFRDFNRRKPNQGYELSDNRYYPTNNLEYRWDDNSDNSYPASYNGWSNVNNNHYK